MEEIINPNQENQTKPMTKKQVMLNYCVLIFVVVLTLVSFAAFFVALLTEGNNSDGAIVSIYVLAMLLGVPTLKVFLDKATTPLMKKMNIIGIITAFGAIAVMVLANVVQMAFC